MKVWFQNRRAKCRKHESQHYKSLSPQTFIPVNNNNNNNNSTKASSTSSTTAAATASLSRSSAPETKLGLADVKVKTGANETTLVGTSVSSSVSPTSLLSTLKVEQPIQSFSMSKNSLASKRLLDYRRLEAATPLFNPLQVTTKSRLNS